MDADTPVAAVTGGGTSGGTAPGARPARAHISPVTVAIALTAALALLLRLYALLRPGLFSVTQYDDGPYFGSAVRLVYGALPYKDFALVQPPGITLLMSPVALLSYLTGTDWGLAVARVLTVVASTAGIVLAGRLVRHRGLAATLVTCGFLAVYPPGVAAAHTVLLEPWVGLACLAGAVATFEGDRVSARARRLVWGGVAFGFAGTVKAWAIVPVVVVVVLCLPHVRRAGLFVAGVATGFVIPVLPFALAAPHQFYDSVVVAQLARVGARTPLSPRLEAFLAIGRGAGLGSGTVLAIAVAVAVALAGAHAALWLTRRVAPAPLDWFALAATGLTVAIFLWPPYFAAHYVAFLGPFFALAVGLTVQRVAAALAPRMAGRSWQRTWVAVAAVLIVVEAIVETPTGHRGHAPVAAAADRVIPLGACALSDQASYLLEANRFVSSVPGCPQMVDSLGTDLALSDGRRPGSGAAAVPAVMSAWREAFSHSQYVLLSSKSSIRVPWDPSLRAYFQDRFRLVAHHSGYRVYARSRPR